MAKFPEHGTTAGASNLLRGRGRTSSSPWLEDTEEKESATTLLTWSDDKNSGRPSWGIPSLPIAERGEEEVPQRGGEGGRTENEEVTAAAAKIDQHQPSFLSLLSPPPDIVSPLPSPAVSPGLSFEKGGEGGRSLRFSPPGILSPVPVPSASDIFSSSSSSASRQHVIAIGGSGERSPPLPPPRESLFSPLLSSTPPLVGPRLATYPPSSSSSTSSSISRSPPLLQQQHQHRPQLLCLPRNVVSNDPADNTKGRKASPDQFLSSLFQDLSVYTSSATPALTLLPWPESPCSYGGSPASAGGGNVPTLHPNIVVTDVPGAILGMPSYVLHNGVRSCRAGPATGLRCSGPSFSVSSSSLSSVMGAAGSVVGASSPSSSFYTGAIDTVQMLILCMRSFTSFDGLRHAAASTTITSAFNPAGSLSSPPLTHTFNTLAAIADHAMNQIEPKTRPASPAEVAIMTTLRDEILTWRLWASVYFTNQPDAFERRSTLVDWARVLCEPFVCERKGETGVDSGSSSSRPIDNEQSSPPMLSPRIYLQHFLGLVHTMEGYCAGCDFSFTASTLEPEYCCSSLDPPSLSLKMAARTENPEEALRTGLLTDTWSSLPPAVTASFVKAFTMKHCLANLMHEKEGGERRVCNHLERKDKEQFAFAAAMLPFSSTGVAPCPFLLLDVVDGSLEAARRTIIKSLDLGRTIPGDRRRYNNKYRLCGVVYRVDNPGAPRGPHFVSECQIGLSLAVMDTSRRGADAGACFIKHAKGQEEPYWLYEELAHVNPSYTKNWSVMALMYRRSTQDPPKSVIENIRANVAAATAAAASTSIHATEGIGSTYLHQPYPFQPHEQQYQGHEQGPPFYLGQRQSRDQQPQQQAVGVVGVPPSFHPYQSQGQGYGAGGGGGVRMMQTASFLPPPPQQQQQQQEGGGGYDGGGRDEW